MDVRLITRFFKGMIPLSWMALSSFALAQEPVGVQPDVEQVDDSAIPSDAPLVDTATNDHACVDVDVTDFEQKAAWLSRLGFKVNSESGQIYASDDTWIAIQTLSEDAVLDHLLSLFVDYLQHANIAEQRILSEWFDNTFENTDLSQFDKIGIFLTLKPFFVDHAKDSGDMISYRKLIETAHSFERLWSYQLDIVCSDDLRELTFGLNQLIPGADVTQMTLKPSSCPEIEKPKILSCKTQIVSQTGTDNSLDNRLQDALWALSLKDNEFIIQSVGRLSRMLRQLQTVQGGLLPQEPETQADRAEYHDKLCRLIVIEMLSVEQNRFAELAALDASIHALTQTTFYDRMKMVSGCSFKGDFAGIWANLKASHGDILHWLISNYDPKKSKKRNKAVSAWIKKGTKQSRFVKRIWASWTSWSMGEYKQAAQIAGDVMEGKTRLVHPQLYSYDLILKAIRGEFPVLEDLQTYTRLMNLKSPALVYQTLTQAARWLSSAARRDVVEAVSPYTPGQASAEAAEFYMAYEKELRAQMSADRRTMVGAWLESELAPYESLTESQDRRILWMGDAIEAGRWENVLSIAELASYAASTPVEESFWCQTTNHAHEALGKSPEKTCDTSETGISCADAKGESWLKQAVRCYHSGIR